MGYVAECLNLWMTTFVIGINYITAGIIGFAFAWLEAKPELDISKDSTLEFLFIYLFMFMIKNI